MTTNKDELFLCEDGSEHMIGRNAVDVGHGARPSGAQICLKCKESLATLINKRVQEARFDEHKIIQKNIGLEYAQAVNGNPDFDSEFINKIIKNRTEQLTKEGE